MHLFCISIVFIFSWDGCNTQEKWKTKVMQNFGAQVRCIIADVQVAYWKPYMKCENLRMTYEKSARGVTNVREAWKWVHELCMKRGNNLRITSFMSLIIPTTWTDTLVHITYVNVVLFLLGADFCSRSSYFISGGTQKQGDNFFCFIYKTLYERGLGLPWLSRV